MRFPARISTPGSLASADGSSPRSRARLFIHLHEPRSRYRCRIQSGEEALWQPRVRVFKVEMHNFAVDTGVVWLRGRGIVR